MIVMKLDAGSISSADRLRGVARLVQVGVRDVSEEEIVQLIQRRFNYQHVHIFSVHPGRRLVIYQAGTGERSVETDALNRLSKLTSRPTWAAAASDSG